MHVDLTRTQYQGYSKIMDCYLTCIWERMGGKKYDSIGGLLERLYKKKNYGDSPDY